MLAPIGRIELVLAKVEPVLPAEQGADLAHPHIVVGVAQPEADDPAPRADRSSTPPARSTPRARSTANGVPPGRVSCRSRVAPRSNAKILSRSSRSRLESKPMIQTALNALDPERRAVAAPGGPLRLRRRGHHRARRRQLLGGRRVPARRPDAVADPGVPVLHRRQLRHPWRLQLSRPWRARPHPCPRHALPGHQPRSASSPTNSSSGCWSSNWAGRPGGR